MCKLRVCTERDGGTDRFFFVSRGEQEKKRVKVSCRILGIRFAHRFRA